MIYQLTDFLPTTKKEVELRNWDEVDVVFFTGFPNNALVVLYRTGKFGFRC